MANVSFDEKFFCKHKFDIQVVTKASEAYWKMKKVL